MCYEILLAREAQADYRALSAKLRAIVKEAIEVHLRNEPKKTSRSRIKRLRGLRKPQYRLRVEGLRVFYDVVERRVEILAIIEKSAAAAGLKEEGVHEEDSSG